MRQKWSFFYYFILLLLPNILLSNFLLSESTTTPSTTPATTQGDSLLSKTIQLAKGNADFKNLFFKEHEQEFLRLVVEGQSPKTLFISCSDSRVIPELIANASPGQLFVIRTAGNFVPVYDQTISWDGVAATIEYAVKELEVTDIIVCGHSHCGAIKGLFSKPHPGAAKFQLLPKWLKFGAPAKTMTERLLNNQASESDRFLVAEHLSILVQLDHLLSFPFVKEKVESKKIYLHGWYFAIERGEISYFDPETYRFVSLSNLIQGGEQKPASTLPSQETKSKS